MKIRYRLLVFFVLVLILSNFRSLQNSSGLESANDDKLDNSTSSSQIMVNQEDENASIAYIETDETTIQLGDDITFFFGMRNGSEFKPGYNYSIYLSEGTVLLGNDTSILSNYTLITVGVTKSTFEEYSIKSIGLQSPITPAPSNYTILFVVNSTSRGMLNTTANFEIIIPPGSLVNHSFIRENSQELDNDIISLNVNETVQLSIALQNIGSTNAFNVTLVRQNINEPIGFGNFTLPDVISVLAPLEKVLFNFTVTPAKYGIGKLSFNLGYTDGLGISAGSTPVLVVWAFPELRGSFSLVGGSVEIEYKEGEDIPINVFFAYDDPLPLSPVIIKFKLTSDAMTFLPEELQYTQGKASYAFNGNPIEPGEIEIEMLVTILDEDGPDVHEYVEFDLTINLIAGPVQTSDKSNFSDYLPIIALILYFILIVTLAILYYREDIRTKFFTNVLGLHLIGRIDYKTNSIVIDGSNIAWEQTNKDNKPMIDNIIKAYKSLKENGFKQIVIIADAALRYQIDDKDELDRLVKTKFIKLVPAKVNADGFILRFSAENGYLILSNDLYKE
ncbi:MAG: NYN domain-containing protein, partial [Candidatus Kariarchaeaceae archaeon]